MGLISRVSSRTYRKKTLNNQTSKPCQESKKTKVSMPENVPLLENSSQQKIMPAFNLTLLKLMNLVEEPVTTSPMLSVEIYVKWVNLMMLLIDWPELKVSLKLVFFNHPEDKKNNCFLRNKILPHRVLLDKKIKKNFFILAKK